MKEALELFNQAYDKAARQRPAGQDPGLTAEEESILMACIGTYEARKLRALGCFRQYMHERYPGISEGEIEYHFKKACREDNMPFSGYKSKKKKRR